MHRKLRKQVLSQFLDAGWLGVIVQDARDIRDGKTAPPTSFAPIPEFGLRNKNQNRTVIDQNCPNGPRQTVLDFPEGGLAIARSLDSELRIHPPGKIGHSVPTALRQARDSPPYRKSAFAIENRFKL